MELVQLGRTKQMSSCVADPALSQDPTVEHCDPDFFGQGMISVDAFRREGRGVNEDLDFFSMSIGEAYCLRHYRREVNFHREIVDDVFNSVVRRHLTYARTQAEYLSVIL